jgi:hypothetical protein
VSEPLSGSAYQIGCAEVENFIKEILTGGYAGG